MLNDVPMPIRQRIRFQHDGAPAHFSIDVLSMLPVATPEDLVGRIVEAAGCVRDTPGIFEKVRCSVQRRCQACLDASGKNFEHLLGSGSQLRPTVHMRFLILVVFINFVKQQSDGIRDPSLSPAFSPILSDLEEVLDDSPEIASSLTRSQSRLAFIYDQDC
ncbi:ATP-binding cassette sub-family A member 2 [Trichonephila clavipes]|nr:ATP-binding cassette sub-family A member 2 [Trichonephila clavipes]